MRDRQQSAAGALAATGVIDSRLIQDYLAGRLDPDVADCLAVELDGLPPDELQRLLDVPQPVLPAGQPPPFTPALRRLTLGSALGVGVSGQVDAVRDGLLDRTVALKRLRPRAPAETLPAYLARIEAFRREAAVTAGLEHPGVIPVHDVGYGAQGEPAFAMKLLAGESLGELLVDGPIGVTRAVDIAIRIADAVGFAHVRGFVHRDLKPEHVWIGNHGEVTLIDWGLAARTGTDAVRVGTEGWMSPEQEAGAVADPRMDVWVIGRLLTAMLGGTGSRGLYAIATRCCAAQVGQRYADGAAVAEDLRRWLAEGISHAETPGPLLRLLAVVRRKPGLAAILALGLLLGCLALYLPLHGAAVRRDIALAAIRDIAATPLGDAQQLAQLRRRLAPLVAMHPELDEARQVEANLEQAARLVDEDIRRRLLADTLDALYRSWRVRGPWPEEAAQLEATLRLAGVWTMRPGQGDLGGHPEAARIRRALAQLLVARRQAGHPVDQRIHVVLAADGDPAWSAVERVIAAAVLDRTELTALPGSDLDVALSDPATADVILAAFVPDTRLVAAAYRQIDADPGAFWPRICLARDAVGRGDWAQARGHALVALGRESASLWPRLSLGYADLAAADWAALLVDATHAVAANPGHHEAGIMQAIALARLGRQAEAIERLAALQVGDTLRWHRAHRMGHPVESLADAVQAAGLLDGARP